MTPDETAIFTILKIKISIIRNDYNCNNLPEKFHLEPTQLRCSASFSAYFYYESPRLLVLAVNKTHRKVIDF